MSTGWTPIALSRDVPAGTTRAVRLDGREVMIWRAEGEAHVWEDRCPHRGMRLSLGFVRDNSMNCLYHGWQYGAYSSCIRIPAHPDLTVPPSIKANAYASAEAGGFIWVRLAGEDALPALPDTVTPLLSLAVDADGPDAPVLVFPFEGATLTIRWHPVQPGKIMLHAVIEGTADLAAAAAYLRDMRSEMEKGLAA